MQNLESVAQNMAELLHTGTQDCKLTGKMQQVIILGKKIYLNKQFHKKQFPRPISLQTSRE